MSKSNWLNAKKPEGQNEASRRFLKQVEEIDRGFAMNQEIVYFLVEHLNMYECRSLLRSGRKSRNLIKALISNLEEYAVTDEWEPALRKMVEDLRERYDYVHDNVIPESIRMTNFYPYFQEVGFSKLDDFAERHHADWKNKRITQEFLEEITAWKKAHSNEIVDHMEAVVRGQRK